MVERTPEARERELEVLASNADAVAVLRYGKADYLMGFGAAVYHGLPTTEIQSTAKLLGIAADEDLLWRLRVLEGAYGQEVNKRHKTSRSRRGK